MSTDDEKDPPVSAELAGAAERVRHGQPADQETPSAQSDSTDDAKG
ncbi:hypothetical protein ACP3TD_09485 [Pseudarthrobacter sp. 1G09]